MMIAGAEGSLEAAAYGPPETLVRRRKFGHEIQCLMHAFGEVRYCARDVLELMEDMVRDGVRLFALEVAAREPDGRITAAAVARRFCHDQRALRRLCKLVEIMAKQQAKGPVREAAAELEAFLQETEMTLPSFADHDADSHSGGGAHCSWLVRMVEQTASAKLVGYASAVIGSQNAQKTGPGNATSGRKPAAEAQRIPEVASRTPASATLAVEAQALGQHVEEPKTPVLGTNRVVTPAPDVSVGENAGNYVHETRSNDTGGHEQRLQRASARQSPTKTSASPGEARALEEKRLSQGPRDDSQLDTSVADESSGVDGPSEALPDADHANHREPGGYPGSTQAHEYATTPDAEPALVTMHRSVPQIRAKAADTTKLEAASEPHAQRTSTQKPSPDTGEREANAAAGAAAGAKRKRLRLDNETWIEVQSETRTESSSGKPSSENPVFMIIFRADFILKQCLPRHQYADFVACRNVRYTYGESRAHQGVTRAVLFRDWLHLTPEEGVIVTEDGLHALGHVAWELTGLLTQAALLFRHYDEIAHERGDARAVCWRPARHILAALGNGIATAIVLPMETREYEALRRELELFELTVAPGRVFWRGFAKHSTRCLEPWHLRETWRRLRHGRRVTGLCAAATEQRFSFAGLLGAHPLRVCFDPNKRLIRE